MTTIGDEQIGDMRRFSTAVEDAGNLADAAARRLGLTKELVETSQEALEDHEDVVEKDLEQARRSLIMAKSRVEHAMQERDRVLEDADGGGS